MRKRKHHLAINPGPTYTQLSKTCCIGGKLNLGALRLKETEPKEAAATGVLLSLFMLLSNNLVQSPHLYLCFEHPAEVLAQWSPRLAAAHAHFPRHRAFDFCSVVLDLKWLWNILAENSKRKSEAWARHSEDSSVETESLWGRNPWKIDYNWKQEKTGVQKGRNVKQERGEFEMNPGDTITLKDQSRSVGKKEFRCQQGRENSCLYMALLSPSLWIFWSACEVQHTEYSGYLSNKTLGRFT